MSDEQTAQGEHIVFARRLAAERGCCGKLLIVVGCPVRGQDASGASLRAMPRRAGVSVWRNPLGVGCQQADSAVVLCVLSFREFRLVNAVQLFVFVGILRSLLPFLGNRLWNIICMVRAYYRETCGNTRKRTDEYDIP